MEQISVVDSFDLLKQLSTIDISVPLRSEGRTKEHCERWSICRWLSTYPSLNFPLILMHRDKPDFYLRTGKQEIGIEHTEAIPEDYAHATVVSERRNDNSVVDMSLFKWGQKREAKEIYEIASRTKLTVPGWDDDAPEYEWASAIYEIAKNKTVLLVKDEFVKYPINYLLIYDNLPLPYIDHPKASSILRSYLKNYWNSGTVFNGIFVHQMLCLFIFPKAHIKHLKLKMYKTI
jgi:hypothetical protein